MVLFLSSAKSIGKTGAQFPYLLATKKALIVEGLPSGLEMPRSLGRLGIDKLKKLKEAIPSLTFRLASQQ